MAQKPIHSSGLTGGSQRRPGQDLTIRQRQSGQFPGVGMTLRSYQYDSRDRHRVPPGSNVVVKRGFFKRLIYAVTPKRVLLMTLVGGLLVGGYVGAKFAYNAHKLFGGSVLGLLVSTKLKGEGQGRVNILLAGNSADDPGHNGANLTDSIMIVSLDTRNNKAFLLSVPRDLWVDIPGEGHAKINETYNDGQLNHFKESGYPDGGMGLLAKVIQANLGVSTQYYALVDYNALMQAVDAVGGVNFTVKSADPRGLYDPNIDYSTHGPLVKLTNGSHHLSGEQALDLARARGDSVRAYGFPMSDFDRTQHQRQLLVALKNKASSAGTLANPAKLSSLSDAIGNNVKTDFSSSEVKRLYDLSQQINSNNITSLGLNDAEGKNLLGSYTYRGQSALIPALGVDDYSDIQAYIRRQLSSNPVVQENAKIVLLNATQVSGLAARQKLQLVDDNLRITKVGDAQIKQAATQIIDASGDKKPATRSFLVRRFGNNVTKLNPYQGVYDADFIVLVGQDKAAADAKSQ